MMLEPGVVAAIAAAGALLAVVVGGLAATAARWYRGRRPPVTPERQRPRPQTTAAVPVVAADRDVATRLTVALRRRPWLRRSLSATAVVMVAVAVGLLGYPVFTDVVQGRIQTRLEHQLASPQFRQVYLAGQVEEGDSLTRLRIPSVGVDVVVVEGISDSALRAGAGHYPSTALPCQAGNVGVAGHRTTYGAPFRELDEVRPGDEVILETPVGSCTYRVTEAPFAVPPTRIDVVAPSEAALLTLTTCHPEGSASERLVLRAELVPSEGRSA